MKAFKSFFITFCTLALGAGFAAAGEPVNTKCPVSGKDIDPDKVVELTVKFCCEKCEGKFKADPLAHAAKVAAAAEGKCPISGRDIDEDVSVTVGIGACCGKCVPKITAEPASFFGKLQKGS